MHGAGQQRPPAFCRQEGRFCFLVQQGVPRWLFACMSTAWVSGEVGPAELLGPPGSWAGKADFPVSAVQCSHHPFCTLSSVPGGVSSQPTTCPCHTWWLDWSLRSREGRLTLGRILVGKSGFGNPVSTGWERESGFPQPLFREHGCSTLPADCPLRLCLLSRTEAGPSPSFPKRWLSSFFRVGIKGFFKPGSVLG